MDWQMASRLMEYFCKVKVRCIEKCVSDMLLHIHTHWFNESFHAYLSCVVSFFVCFTDQKANKTSLYNFSKLKKNRKWLKVFTLANTDLHIWRILVLYLPPFSQDTFVCHMLSASCNHACTYFFSHVEYLVEWWHHRLRYRLRWRKLQHFSGRTTWHAEAPSLHEAASEQLLLWPGGTNTHINKEH